MNSCLTKGEQINFLCVTLLRSLKMTHASLVKKKKKKEEERVYLWSGRIDVVYLLEINQDITENLKKKQFNIFTKD